MQVQQMLTQNALDRLIEKIGGGSFAIIFENGDTKYYGDGDPQFTVRLNNDNILHLLQGDLLTNLGDAYIDGQIDVDGDVADLVSLALKSGLMSATQAAHGLTGTVRRAAKTLRSLSQAKENIAHHYDLGNDFFRLWLDESLTYSCAYFRDPSDTLEVAQQQKIDHSLSKLRLQPGETLLDIGCGWGALVIRAAERYDARATGITLSEEQNAGANTAIESHRLQNKANVQLMDYGTLAGQGEQFDKIVSIGMIEHVGKEHLAEFVQNTETLLKTGGLALLHSITSVKEGSINGWIEKHIFPGGYIPTLSEVIKHLSAQDFRIWDVENLGPHYRLTLDQWSTRFERVVPEVLEKFDERFVRMWRFYLRASSAAFRVGSVEVHQILVSRGQPQNLPMTREDIYET